MNQEEKENLRTLKQAAIGDDIARALHLRRDPDHDDRWQTDWGTKTSLGLYRTLKAMLEKADLP